MFSVLIFLCVPNKFCQPNAAICVVPSCRDNGRGRVDEGALCLSSSWWEGIHTNTHCGNPTESPSHEDRHKAPSSTPHHPLSLQVTGATFSCYYSIRLSKFIRYPTEL